MCILKHWQVPSLLFETSHYIMQIEQAQTYWKFAKFSSPKKFSRLIVFQSLCINAFLATNNQNDFSLLVYCEN